MGRNELRIKVIEKISSTFKWLNFIGWSNNNSEYNLIKFTDKLDSEFILWAYVYDSKVNLEFRSNTIIDKEYKDIRPDMIESFIEDIRYVY